MEELKFKVLDRVNMVKTIHPLTAGQQVVITDVNPKLPAPYLAKQMYGNDSCWKTI